MRHAHIIGAGLAGLSAAVRLAQAGLPVTVHEAAKHAGGRCRSFHEPVLDAIVDNGAHLMLSGNGEVRAYLDMINAGDEIVMQPRAQFPFFDAATATRWTLDLGRGRGKLNLLRNLLRSRNRPPGVGALTLLRDLRALSAGRAGTVGACLSGSPAFTVFWRPLTLAVLNTKPEDAAAELLWLVLEQTVLKGGAFARPLLTRQGLGGALVEPALTTLARFGADLYLGQRVRDLETGGGRIAGLEHTGGSEVLAAGDAVVLAVPHGAALDLLPGVTAPSASSSILNVHYRLPDGVEGPSMTGLVNAHAQWLFVRGQVASVTVSAADAWMDKDGDAIAVALWPDVARALGLDEGQELPSFRVIKERRATFAQTPAALRHRPETVTAYANLFLAGDWTATGLPATIEGALKSGRLAAEAVLAS